MLLQYRNIKNIFLTIDNINEPFTAERYFNIKNNRKENTRYKRFNKEHRTVWFVYKLYDGYELF